MVNLQTACSISFLHLVHSYFVLLTYDDKFIDLQCFINNLSSIIMAMKSILKFISYTMSRNY